LKTARNTPSVFYSRDRIFDCRVYFANYEAKGDCDVIISSYHTYVFRHDARQALRNVCYCDITFLTVAPC